MSATQHRAATWLQALSQFMENARSAGVEAPPEMAGLLHFLTCEAGSAWFDAVTTNLDPAVLLGGVYPVPSFPSDSLAKARDHVWEEGALKKGIHCPCCGLLFQSVHRRFNKGMAGYLAEIVIEFQKTGTWVEIKRLPIYASKTQRGDYGYLSNLWCFLEAAPNTNPAKTGSGFWRPNQDGIDFVYGRSRILSHVWHIRDVILAREGEHITIGEVKSFDIRDLLTAPYSGEYDEILSNLRQSYP